MNFLSKKYIYATSNIKPNTYIGGVASTINTKALLASKLGIPVTRIKMFRIVNEDVQANITGTYAIPASAFLNNTSITYFRDEENLVYSIGNSSFFGCTFLIEVKFLNLISIGTSALRLCSSMLAIDFPLLAVANNNCFQGNGAFTYNLPSLTTIGAGAFAYGINCEELNFSTFTTSTGSSQFIGNEAKRFIFSNATSVLGSAFQACANAELIDLSSCMNLGGSVATNNIFTTLKADCEIRVPIALMTVNGGLPDGDLTAYNIGNLVYVGMQPEPNTEIGFLNSETNTQALIAAKLNVPRSRITNVQVLGSNVKFFVLGSYTFVSAAFANNNNILYYRDLAGLVVSPSSSIFRNAINFNEFVFNNLQIVPDQMFRGTALISVDFPQLLSITGSGSFRDCVSLTSFVAPKLNIISSGTNTNAGTFRDCINLVNVNATLVSGITGLNTFHGCSKITSLSFPLLTTIGGGGFRDCSLLESVHFPLLTIVPSNCFLNCTSLLSVDFANVTSLGEACFKFCISLITINLPEVTTIASTVNFGAFSNCTKIEYINIPKCVALGNSSIDNHVFYLIKIACEINSNIELETANAGAPDGDLTYAIESRGATVNYIP